MRHDSSECVEEKLKREKKIKKKKMRKNYTERADLLAYREVRIYIKEKEKKLVNDKRGERGEKLGEKKRRKIIRPVCKCKL